MSGQQSDDRVSTQTVHFVGKKCAVYSLLYFTSGISSEQLYQLLSAFIPSPTDSMYFIPRKQHEHNGP